MSFEILLPNVELPERIYVDDITRLCSLMMKKNGLGSYRIWKKLISEPEFFVESSFRKIREKARTLLADNDLVQEIPPLVSHSFSIVCQNHKIRKFIKLNNQFQ